MPSNAACDSKSDVESMERVLLHPSHSCCCTEVLTACRTSAADCRVGARVHSEVTPQGPPWAVTSRFRSGLAEGR